jgi:hypothetical protein
VVQGSPAQTAMSTPRPPALEPRSPGHEPFVSLHHSAHPQLRTPICPRQSAFGSRSRMRTVGSRAARSPSGLEPPNHTATGVSRTGYPAPRQRRTDVSL